MTTCAECGHAWGGPPERAVVVVGVLAGVRSVCAGLAADLGADTAWGREGTGSDGSARTVAQLVDRAAHEARHHLRDVTLRMA